MTYWLVVAQRRAVARVLSETRKALPSSTQFDYLRPATYLSLQNAVEKMRPLALVLASYFHLLQIAHCQELSVIRHTDGDIFTIEGKYGVQ